MYFFLKCKTLQLKTLQVNRLHGVEGAGQYLAKVKVKECISFKCISLTV